jgi:hypothetical protein
MFFKMSLKIYIYIYIHSTFMRYMFRPHRVIFRKHLFKESTALCTLYYRMSVLGIIFIAASLCTIVCAAVLVVCILC